MKEFWALVGNNCRLRRHKRRGASGSLGWKIFFIIALILTLGGLAYSIYYGDFPPAGLFNSLLAMTFIAFGLSISSIQGEWQGQTVSWWLTLPYPRSELLLAKLVANFIRLLKISLWFIGFFAIIIVLGWTLNPAQWTAAYIIDCVRAWSLLYVLRLLAAPLAINLGMLLALVIRTRRAWTPLLWALVIAMMIFMTYTINPLVIQNPVQMGFGAYSFIDPVVLILRVIIILIAALALFFISSYVLSRHTEV